MLLRYGLGLTDAAETVERAIDAVLEAGARTPDLATEGERTFGTEEIGSEIARLVLWGGAVQPAL
jgi:3-isopropylmalate dehydrogenase